MSIIYSKTSSINSISNRFIKVVITPPASETSLTNVVEQPICDIGYGKHT